MKRKYLVIILASCLLLTSCIGAPAKKVTTTPNTLINRVSTLEDAVANLSNSMTQLVSGDSTYSFVLKNNIIQVQLPVGSDSIQLDIHAIPQTLIKLSKTDYDNAFKEACSADYINISYVPLLTWDGTNYYVSEMLCHSTEYTLTNDVQNVQFNYSTRIPCDTYIGVLEKIP
jgi:hypothetical protein